jgi:hypothetical protein
MIWNPEIECADRERLHELQSVRLREMVGRIYEHVPAFEIIDVFPPGKPVEENALYIIIKQTDVVEVIKRSKVDRLTVGRQFGIIGYNDNPFYEVIENGISAISIDWEEMGNLAADFVLTGKPISCYLPTKIIRRGSF